MKTYKELICERSLWSDDDDKKDFFSKEENLVDAFLFNFLGIVGLINTAKNTKHIKSYLKRDQKLRLQNITDQNNDISLIVKLMVERGYFLKPQSANEITRFLVKTKTGAVDSVDPEIIHGWLSGLKPSFRIKLSPRLKPIFDYFMSDKDFNATTIALKKLANKRKRASGDFRMLAKLTQINKGDVDVVLRGDDLVFSKKQATGQPISPTQAQTTSTSTTITQKKDETPSIASLSVYDAYIVAVEKTETEIKEFLNKHGAQINDNVGFEIGYILKHVLFNDTHATGQEMFGLFKAASNKNNKGEAVVSLETSENQDFSFYIHSRGGLDALGDIVLHFKNNHHKQQNVDWDGSLDLPGALSLMFFYCIVTRSILKNRIFLDEHHFADYFSKYHDKTIVSYLKMLRGISEFEYHETISDISKAKGNWKYNTQHPFIIEMQSLLVQEFKDMTKAFKMPRYFAFFYYLLLPDSIKQVINEDDVLTDEKIDPYWFRSVRDQESTQYLYYLFMLRVLYSAKNGIKEDTPLGHFGISSKEYQEKLIKYFDDNNINIQHLKQFYINLLKFFDFEINTDKDYESLKKIEEKWSQQKKHHKPNIVLEYNNYLENNELFSNNKEDFTNILFDYINDPESDGNITHFLSLFESNLNYREFTEKENKKIIDTLSSNPKELGDFVENLGEMTNIKKRKNTAGPFIDLLGGMFVDFVKETKYTDTFETIMKGSTQSVRNKIRQNLVTSTLVKKSFFTTPLTTEGIDLTNERLKQILKYNDVELAGDVVPRKGKNETWVEYINKVAENDSSSVLEGVKILDSGLSKDEIRKLNVELVNNHYAGKHGNIYPKITKIFDVKLPTEEYEAFYKQMKTADTLEQIIPAFHGTGKIAANMILRYGFRVIKAHDDSVAGRMMGDGVYFANHIDKSLQYVGDSGHARNLGTVGYIFDMESVLGKRSSDYNAMGLGNDRIRSPEWVVKDARKQLKLMKAYEVELVSEKQYTDYVMGITESKAPLYTRKENVASFLFYDGQIPFVGKNDKVTYMDFKDAKKKMPFGIEVVYGPRAVAVEFRFGVEKTETIDIRYGQSMKTSLLNKYVELWQNSMRTKKTKINEENMPSFKEFLKE